MKKIVAVLMLASLMTTLCACGNMSLGIGNFEYNKIHIDTYHYSGCFEIEKWYDNATGIEVKIKDVGSIYASEGDYILIQDECPFCDRPTEKGGAAK